MILNELSLILYAKVINNAIPPSGIIFRFKPTQEKLIILLIIIFDFPDYEIHCNTIYVRAFIRLSAADRALGGL